MFEVDFKILNQKATPAIYADTLALRPNPGFKGRLFVATDSPYGVFRDTGAAWVQVAAGTGGSGSTGVNGLNGTTNIGLGGTLANNTIISGSSLYDFSFSAIDTFSFTSKNFNLQCNDIFSQQSVISAGNGSLSIIQYTGSISSQLFFEPQSIQSKFSRANFGLLLDNSSGKFSLGDYNNDRKYNSFVVNDDTDRFYITTSYNQVNNNQDLFYVSNNPGASERFVKLGDFNNYTFNTSFILDDLNGFIKTTTFLGDNGIFISDNENRFGAFNSSFYLYLNLNISTNTISARNSSSTDNGLKLDFLNNLYQIGNFAGDHIDIISIPGIGKIELFTEELLFTGSTLQSNTSSGNSGEHLVIRLNGNQYKIKLENP